MPQHLSARLFFLLFCGSAKLSTVPSVLHLWWLCQKSSAECACVCVCVHCVHACKHMCTCVCVYMYYAIRRALLSHLLSYHISSLCCIGIEKQNLSAVSHNLTHIHAICIIVISTSRACTVIWIPYTYNYILIYTVSTTTTAKQAYTIYALIFAGQIFCELPFGRVFCVFYFTNGSLFIYISIIQKYIREDIFCEGRLPCEIRKNKVLRKLECVQYLQCTW